MGEMALGSGIVKRVFLGNLFPEVASGDLQDLLSKFGSVRDSEIKAKKDMDGKTITTFAFANVQFKDEAGLAKCIQSLNGVRWKKYQIRVQAAQESFLQKLQRERTEKMANFSTNPDPSYDPLKVFKANQRSADSTPLKQEPSPEPIKAKGDGKSKGGLVIFDDEPKESRSERGIQKRAYHSSGSEDNDEVKEQKPRKKKKPFQPSASGRQRYYASSSDNESDDEPEVKDKIKPANGFMSKLENFNSGFWKDSDDESHAQTEQKQKEDANKKRLESLKSRQKNRGLEKSVIQRDLSKPDSAKKKKVIRFDVGDDDSSPPKSNDDHVKKSTLFDDDDEESDDDHDAFQVKPHFEGKSGQKLLNLQSKFASDDRFKIDERFKDSDDDDESADSDQEVTGPEDEQDVSLAAEKEMSLKVLQTIVGDKVTAKTERKGVKFKDTSSLRFDPSEQSHAKFEIKTKSGEDQDSDEQDHDLAQTETPMPEANVSKVHWLQKDVFSKDVNEKSTFTFGFGAKQTDPARADDRQHIQDKTTLQPKKKMLGFLDQNPFKYDSSTDDDSDHDEAMEPVKAITEFTSKLAAKIKSQGGSKVDTENFFVQEDDARFAEAKEFLDQAQGLDVIREKFEEQRPILAGIMKKKLRKKAKRQQQTLQHRRTKKKWSKSNKMIQKKKFVKKK